MVDVSGRSKGSAAERFTTSIRNVLGDENITTGEGGDDGRFSRLQHLGFPPESYLFSGTLPCQDKYSPDVAGYDGLRA